MIDPEKDLVSVSGKKLAVSTAPKLYYFMVNKPKGYICSSVETQEGRGKRVVDLLEPWLADWGRRNTEKVCVRVYSLSSSDVIDSAPVPDSQPNASERPIPVPIFSAFAPRPRAPLASRNVPPASHARRRCCPPGSSRWAALTSPPTASSSSLTTATGHRK